MYIRTLQATNTSLSVYLFLLFNMVGDFCLKSMAVIRLQTVVDVCPAASFI